MSRDPAPSPDLPTYTICLVSHSRSPPLRPEPALEFDLRSVPNPPRAMRQSMTGKHRAIQEELMQDTVFCSELDRAQSTIRAEMKEFELSRRQPAPNKSLNMPTTLAISASDKPIDQGSEDKKSKDVLFVSCFCTRGKHRSPAFVESLMESEDWPATWDVRAIHRELDDVDGDQGAMGKNRECRKVENRMAEWSSHVPSDERGHGGIWED